MKTQTDHYFDTRAEAEKFTDGVDRSKFRVWLSSWLHGGQYKVTLYAPVGA